MQQRFFVLTILGTLVKEVFASTKASEFYAWKKHVEDTYPHQVREEGRFTVPVFPYPEAYNIRRAESLKTAVQKISVPYRIHGGSKAYWRQITIRFMLDTVLKDGTEAILTRPEEKQRFETICTHIAVGKGRPHIYLLSYSIANGLINTHLRVLFEVHDIYYVFEIDVLEDFMGVGGLTFMPKKTIDDFFSPRKKPML